MVLRVGRLLRVVFLTFKLIFNYNQDVPINPSKVVKTEFSTFTYFITSLHGTESSISTDIVVSTNVVTEAGAQVLATPVLPEQLNSDFVSDYLLMLLLL
jgi:hypothetical protein